MRRLGLVGCSTVLALGGISALETTPDDDHDHSADSLTAVRDAGDPGDSVSRGTERVASRLGGVLVRDPSPVPTVTPTADPNVKQPATAPLPAGSGAGRRVVFDITAQQVWLVGAEGAVEHTYLVSGSRYDQLPVGSYEVFSRSEHTTSWHGTETMNYMVRFYRGERSNIGFHDLPVASATGEVVQNLSQLGTPLSDGCIRQDPADAEVLWEFASTGTPVVVVRT